MNVQDYVFFDLQKQKNKPEMYLATPQRRIITKLHDSFNTQGNIKLARINELNFDVPYDIETRNDLYNVLDGITLTRNDVVDSLRDRFLIKFKLGSYVEWYMIRQQGNVGDEEKDSRSVSCFSLGYELTNTKIIQYNVISYTLLEILKGKPFDSMPGILEDSLWSVGHVDDSIMEKHRAYDCTVKNGLDIVFELAEIFDCVPIFDTVNRLVNFYDMDNVGENTGLKISKKKYLKSLTTQSVSDSVTTRLKVYGRDSITIRGINPLGTDYIEDYSYFMFPYGLIDSLGNTILTSDYMSSELCAAITAHREKINNYAPTFTSLIGKLQVITQLSIVKNTELRDLQNELIQLRDSLRVAERGQAGGTTVQFFQDKINEKEKQIEVQEAQVVRLVEERESINQQIDVIKQELAEKNNYTAELLEEKRLFTIEDEFINTSIVEAHELYKAAIEHFNEVNKPKTSISIDIVDFLDVLEEQYNWEKLKLGDIIRIKYEKFNLEESVRIVELAYDFEGESVNLVITNVKDFIFTDEVDSLARLLHRNINMVKTIDVSKVRWDGVGGIRQTLEDILSNPWETLGLQDDVDWSMQDRINELYDEIQEIIIPEIELPDFDAEFSNIFSNLQSYFDQLFADLELEFPEPEPSIVVEDYHESILADWNPSGFQFHFVQQYSVEPKAQISFQRDEGYGGEFDLSSFKPIAEHVRGPAELIEGELIEPYIGLKIVFEGSSIPLTFSGKVSVAATCTGVIEEEEVGS